MFFFVPRTWFHDLKTDGTWPMPKKLVLKGAHFSGFSSRWDHLASRRSPAVCRWAKCLGCCRSDMEDGERWGQTAKRVERILARICPRVVNWTLLMGQPSQIYRHLVCGNAVKASIVLSKQVIVMFDLTKSYLKFRCEDTEKIRFLQINRTPHKWVLIFWYLHSNFTALG